MTAMVAVASVLFSRCGIEPNHRITFSVRRNGHPPFHGPARGLDHPRPFQDHEVRPRIVNVLSMDWLAHRVASVTSARPDRRRAQIARLRRAAMILGLVRVLTCDLSSWYRVSRSQ